MLADVFEPAERGKWMGIASAPALLSPILGPPFGGALALKFGWRATFVAAAVSSGLLLLSGVFLKVGRGRAGRRRCAPVPCGAWLCCLRPAVQKHTKREVTQPKPTRPTC